MKEQCRQNVKIIYFMGVPGIPGGRLPGGFVRGGGGFRGFRVLEIRLKNHAVICTICRKHFIPVAIRNQLQVHPCLCLNNLLY